MEAIHRLWRNRLQRDTLLLLTLQVSYRVSGVVLLAILSRYLPAKDIGVYFFALSFAESFTLIASFRLSPVLIRRVAADPEQAAARFAPFLGFRLASGPLYLLCVGVAAVAFTGPIWLVVVFVACYTWLENLYFVFTNLFLALQRVSYSVAIGLMVEGLFLTIFLFGMLWKPSLQVLLGADLLRSIGLLAVAAWVTQSRLFPLRLSWDSSLLKASKPFVLLNLIARLQEKSDVLLLGFFAEYGSVGYYALAWRAVSTSFFVPEALGQSYFPHLAAGGLCTENRRRFVHGSLALLGTGLLGLGVVFLGANFLARVVYGTAAVETITPLLRVVSLVFPIGFLRFFFSSALQALHQERKALTAAAIASVVSVLANCAAIPVWGVFGVAGVRVLSNLLELTVLFWYLRRMWIHTTPREAPTLVDISVPTAGPK